VLKRRETPFVNPEKEMSWLELEERIAKGEKLVILDNLVLDVSEYRFSHPGGKFVID
jgi:cytochrome b involved in lipid metabolism